MIAFDTETAPIAPGLLAPPLACVSVAGEGGVALVYWQDEEQIRELFTGDVELVGHNVAYDCAVIGAQYPELLPLIFEQYEEDGITDTMLRQRLIDIAHGCLGPRGPGKHSYSLAALTKRHLDIDLEKDEWRLKYGALRDVPLEDWPQGAKDYALGDAAATYAVHQAQETDAYWLKDQYRQARASFALHLMSCWGLTTDQAAVRKFADGVRAERARLCEVLVDAGLKRPPRKVGGKNPRVEEGARDMTAARGRMFAVHTESTLPLTKKGAIALDEDACLKSGDPVLKAWAEFSSAEHRLSTDVPLLERTLIQARFSSPLETGRTSTSPNIQNLAKEGGIRECFVPRPGYVYAAVDFSQLELHTWAQCCLILLGRSRLAEILNAGEDVHSMIGGQILGLPWQEVKRRSDEKEPKAYRARQCGKVVDFGCPGGMGADRLVVAATAYGVTLTRDEAASLKNLWRKLLPEAQPWLDYIARLTEKPDARVEQIFSERFRGGLRYTDAANTFFQGLGADAAKGALWLVSKACYVGRDSALFGSRPVNFPHDEVIAEVPEELGHECLQEIERLMIEGATPWLPDVPPRVEGVLMRRWSKQAKRIEQDGRVIAWQ